MAAKRGPGRKFQKGESGNPRGSSARKRDLARIARLTNEQVEQVGSLLLQGNRAELKELAESPDASVLQVWVSGLIVNSMKQGCAGTFKVLMDRFVGKPRETVELTGQHGKPLSVEVARREMTEQEMRERADLLARQRAEALDD